MRYIGLSVPWSIENALKWRQEQLPKVSAGEALVELGQVCASGKVRLLGSRWSTSPYWSDERKIAFQFGPRKEEFVPTGELSELYFDAHGEYRGGTLNWKSTRTPAWWPVEIASDDLIQAWLAYLNTRQGGEAEARPKKQRSEKGGWALVRPLAFKWLEEEGAPAELGDQAKLENFIVELLAKRASYPAESTVRQYVVRWIEEFKERREKQSC